MPFLVIFVFSASCGAQHPEAQGTSVSSPQAVEMLGSERPKLSPSGEEGKNYVPGEILVKFKDSATEEAIGAIQREVHLETIRVVFKPHLYLMKILDGASVESVIERLRTYQEVQYAEPNFIRTTH